MCLERHANPGQRSSSKTRVTREKRLLLGPQIISNDYYNSEWEGGYITFIIDEVTKPHGSSNKHET